MRINVAQTSTFRTFRLLPNFILRGGLALSDFHGLFKKSSFQNTDFSRLTRQPSEKTYLHRMFVKIFQVLADEGMGK